MECQRAASVRQHLAVTVSYVGDAGRHVFYRWDHNTFEPSSDLAVNALSFNDRMPYGPTYQFFTNAYDQSNQSTTGYQGASLSVEKRYSHGLTFTSAFTYGRSYDYGTHNAYDLANPGPDALSRGPQDQDRRFVLVFSHVWELPFGHGRAYMNHKGPADAVLGGWKLSGIETVQSGQPFSVTWGDSSILNANCCTLTPNITGNPFSSGTKTQSEWFDPAAFEAPAKYTFGNVGRNNLRGPGYFTVDLSLGKTFKFTERLGLELQLEAFNALNRGNLGQPNSDAFAGIGGGAGYIGYIRGTMRRLQIGGTLRF